MQEQWEYKLLSGCGGQVHLFETVGRVVDGWKVVDQGKCVDHGPFSQETLNRLGKEGWELVSLQISFWGWHTLILKRKVASA
jgi:hypothetical protein